MTRFLAEALKDGESSGRALLGLEAAHGHPNTDIRFSEHVRRATRDKVRELGLDPNDTSPEELYHALGERMKDDDARLTKRLRTLAATHVSAEGEVVSGMVHALGQLPGSRHSFALKNSRLKAILRQIPPKKAMKSLGYRSLDSFLKHEQPAAVMAAACLVESASWKQRLLDRYGQLQAADFEDRDIQVISPSSRHWRELAAETVGISRHNILSFRELGTLVLLPLPRDIPSGAVTASLSLALSELNQIRAGGTFLKLCQVRTDFGCRVRTVAAGEPQLSVKTLKEPAYWQLVQRYYSRLADTFRESVFEPHIRLDDMVWQPIEHGLSVIDPDFKFWQDSGYLGMLHDHRPVSMNVIDAALNSCNGLGFDQRVNHYFRQSLWYELLLRYLDPAVVEQAVISVLQPSAETQPVKEAVTA